MKNTIILIIIFIFCLCKLTYSQDLKIEGKVYDKESKLPLSGAIKGYFILDAVLNYNVNNRYQLGLSVENLLNSKHWNEAQFDTESRLPFEKDPTSELHFTPGTPINVKGNLSIFF